MSTRKDCKQWSARVTDQEYNTIMYVLNHSRSKYDAMESLIEIIDNIEDMERNHGHAIAFPISKELMKSINAAKKRLKTSGWQILMKAFELAEKRLAEVPNWEI